MTHNFAELVCVVGRENKLTLLQTTEDSLIERIFKRDFVADREDEGDSMRIPLKPLEREVCHGVTLFP